jgi:hypothetical protein
MTPASDPPEPTPRPRSSSPLQGFKLGGTPLEKAADVAADLVLDRPLFPMGLRRSERERSMEDRKAALVARLARSGIDPVVFDGLLSSEIDRRLKTRFGWAFLGLTCLFTAASYLIVIFNGIYDWQISDFAITSLIIETPIQFIGLLYIIARNLFPQTAGATAAS